MDRSQDSRAPFWTGIVARDRMDFQFPMNFRRALSAYFLFDFHE